MRAPEGKTHGIDRVLVLAIAVIAICSGARTGWAQDWTMKSNITQSGTYDSNLLLDPTNKVSAFGSLTVPELKLERDGPASSVILDSQFKFAEYFNHSSLNSDAQRLNLKANNDLSERSTLSLNADFDRDTTLTSDQDITGHFLTKPIRYISWDVGPSWTYQLSPIDTLTWTANYLSVSYDNTTLETDYRYYGTQFNYNHQLSELASITGSLSYNRYEGEDSLHTKQDIYGGLVGYKYAPTERFSIDGSVGLDYVVKQQKNVGTNTGDLSDVGYRAKFDATYEINDQTKATLSLSHDTEPSGEGEQVTRNRGDLMFSYQMTELTEFDLIASYADNEDYFNSGSGSRSSEGLSRYWAIGPSVTWRVTQELSLGASYQLRHKVFETDGGSATDNAAFVTLRYAFPDQDWSGF